ncbi:MULTISPECIES: Txe/YoeB family addiction module toxin [unclassified Fibrobacter]|uniref:Txe/YoeB family addiction module toxin n=1 Tax=unclassified Fibrobacter TaxID=2634177 RepID=UPI0009343202|nr:MULTISPECIES: Txe/YoeB family addiction module toxin [unclassified Fibrobacter]OWV02507.1 Txe/YoeB family addiction module toxin [Fibrobacter sp. UWH3]
MPYEVNFTPKATEDLQNLQRSAPQALKKLAKLLDELREHPRTGTGQVEQLRHYSEETWSRRITKEHRLVYQIHDDVVQVLVISVYGHY